MDQRRIVLAHCRERLVDHKRPKRIHIEELVRHPETNRLVRDIMAEAEAVAGRLRIELPISIDRRIAGAAEART